MANYRIAPPTHLQDSKAEQAYASFMERGPNMDRYRPPERPVREAVDRTPMPDNSAGGDPGSGSPVDPGAAQVGTGGETGGGSGGNPNMNVGAGHTTPDHAGVTNNYQWNNTTGFNPIDDGPGLHEHINKLFPNQGVSPSGLTKFLVGMGPNLVGVLGWLSGVPGLGWLAKKIIDKTYWKDTAWQNLAPEQKSLIDKAVDEYMQQSYVDPSSRGATGSRDRGDYTGEASGWSRQVFGPSRTIYNSLAGGAEWLKKGVTNVIAMPGSK